MIEDKTSHSTPNPTPTREDHFGYQPSIEKGYQPATTLNPGNPPQGGSGVPPKPVDAEPAASSGSGNASSTSDSKLGTPSSD